MSDNPNFEAKMLQGAFFEMPSDELLPNLCEFARPFAADCQELLDEVLDKLSDLTVNVGLLQLQRKYFFWYETAPPVHRSHMGTRGGHTCIHQVYLHYYRALDRQRGALNPPLLRQPAPVISPPPPTLEGTILGLEE